MKGRDMDIRAPICMQFPYLQSYCSCDNIQVRDWFFARLFVTYSARDHAGVQLQVFDYNFG